MWGDKNKTEKPSVPARSYRKCDRWGDLMFSAMSIDHTVYFHYIQVVAGTEWNALGPSSRVSTPHSERVITSGGEE